MKQKLKELVQRFLTDKRTREHKETIQKIEHFELSNIENLIEKNFQCDIHKDCILSSHFYGDIEFWDHVFPKIDKTHLLGGKYITKQILNAPISDLNELNKRKQILQEYEKNVKEEDFEYFKKLKELEHHVLWSFQDLEENVQDLYHMVFFKLYAFKKLNNIPEAITINNIYRILLSPLIGILSPIIYFLVPYLVVKHKFKLEMSFQSYLKIIYHLMMNSGELFYDNSNYYKGVQMVSYMFSLLFYFTGLFNSFEISKSLYKITKHITFNIQQIGQYLHDSMELISKYWKDNMKDIFGVKNLKSLEEEIQYVQTFNFKPFQLLSNFGKQLHTYKTLNKDILKSILQKTYILDAIHGFILYKKENDYQYPEFVNRSLPILTISGMKHPAIPKEKCVANDLKMDGKNIIVTGTNAGGKSVFIKSILINAILSQTCTISICDQYFVYTPLKYINAQINVPDCTGHESLFEAEMHRCKHNLDCLTNLKENEKSLIIMDEIFSSTNPIEAISGAYAVCKKMSSFEHNLLIFTTHFNYLTNLKRTGKFINYKMQTILEGENIKFTYKLVPGVNKHLLALELLKRNGFDNEIIDDALEIKRKFT